MDLFGADMLPMARMLLIFIHILAIVAAGIGIAFGDYAIFSGEGIDTPLLRKAGKVVTIALCALWASGLAVIGIDTSFLYAELANKPKLLAKLTVVGVLTINGIALHFVAFKRFENSSSNTTNAMLVPALLGGLSAVTWIYAAFLGLAKPVAARLGYAGLMSLYGMAVLLGTIVALGLVKPRLAQRFEVVPVSARPSQT